MLFPGRLISLGSPPDCFLSSRPQPLNCVSQLQILLEGRLPFFEFISHSFAAFFVSICVALHIVLQAAGQNPVGAVGCFGIPVVSRGRSPPLSNCVRNSCMRGPRRLFPLCRCSLPLLRVFCCTLTQPFPLLQTVCARSVTDSLTEASEPVFSGGCNRQRDPGPRRCLATRFVSIRRCIFVSSFHCLPPFPPSFRGPPRANRTVTCFRESPYTSRRSSSFPSSA